MHSRLFFILALLCSVFFLDRVSAKETVQQEELQVELTQDRQAPCVLSREIIESPQLEELITQAIAYGKIHGQSEEQIATVITGILLNVSEGGYPGTVAMLWNRVAHKKHVFFNACYNKACAAHDATIQTYNDTAQWCSDWKTSLRRAWWLTNAYLKAKHLSAAPVVVLGLTTIAVGSKLWTTYKVASFLSSFIAGVTF